MTSRCYFSLIRAQQEEYWPCSISLPQSLASTQVSNYQMLNIPQISPLWEGGGKGCSATVTGKLQQVMFPTSAPRSPTSLLFMRSLVACGDDPWAHQMRWADLVLQHSCHYFSLPKPAKGFLGTIMCELGKREEWQDTRFTFLLFHIVEIPIKYLKSVQPKVHFLKS